MSEKQKESIRFVIRHYSAGAFKAGRGRWHEYIPAEPWWRRRGIAAAAGCVVLAAAASAGLYFGLSPSKQVPETTSPPPVVQQPDSVCGSTERSIAISFRDAPLKQVCSEIENVYGVELAGIPDTDTTLTLEYEGTAYDLVCTINDLLGSNIRIDE